jgi:hypothetical protein
MVTASLNLIKKLGWYRAVWVAPVNGNLFLGSPKFAGFAPVPLLQIFYHAKSAVKPNARKPIQGDQCRAIPFVFSERRQLQHPTPSADTCRAGVVCASTAI